MKIYSLTPIGDKIAHTPVHNVTPGWRVLYFLRRHQGRATDEQIKEFTGLKSDEFYVTMRKLTSGKNPVVSVIES